MPKIVDKEAKKEEIISAAIRIFAKQGVAKTKMIDIARTAGIGKGTIYEYFKDKNEIFLESFIHFTQMMDATMGRRLIRLTDPIEKMQAMIKGWIEIIHIAGYDFIEVMLEFWAEGIRQHDVPLFDLNKMYSDYRKMIAAIIEDGIRKGKFKKVDAQIAGSVFIGAMDGLMLQWVLDRDAFNFEDAAEQLLDNFLNGLLL